MYLQCTIQKITKQKFNLNVRNGGDKWLSGWVMYGV